ncbi:hypothetical protein CDAR_166171 [Caerostris darwini]|uniref:Uncharacterized protein n=1 Tax=Caerostris darwini TaxID=1538125 RepID=A0AAV4RRN3_9ARAC|nr:hypothetical protein CDAR_166171 [Caerostris darwini]
MTDGKHPIGYGDRDRWKGCVAVRTSLLVERNIIHLSASPPFPSSSDLTNISSYIGDLMNVGSISFVYP